MANFLQIFFSRKGARVPGFGFKVNLHQPSFTMKKTIHLSIRTIDGLPSNSPTSSDVMLITSASYFDNSNDSQVLASIRSAISYASISKLQKGLSTEKCEAIRHMHSRISQDDFRVVLIDPVDNSVLCPSANIPDEYELECRIVFDSAAAATAATSTSTTLTTTTPTPTPARTKATTTTTTAAALQNPSGCNSPRESSSSPFFSSISNRFSSSLRKNNSTSNHNLTNNNNNNTSNNNTSNNNNNTSTSTNQDAFHSSLLKFERINAHLANERTWLAWIRTAVAILGCAFSFLNLAENSIGQYDNIAVALGIGFVLCVLLTFFTGWFRYKQVKRLLLREINDLNDSFERLGVGWQSHFLGLLLVATSLMYISGGSTQQLYT